VKSERGFFGWDSGAAAQNGVMACGMQAEDHLGCGWFFRFARRCVPTGHASVAADFDERAHAPDIIPPRAAGVLAAGTVRFFLGGA